MNAPNTPTTFPPRIIVLALLLAALFLVAGANFNTSTAPMEEPVEEAQPVCDQAKSPAAVLEEEDQKYRSLAVGTWQDDYKGKRTMHLRDDGTGIMIVELSGWSATLFASRLEFDMVWSVENGRMKKRTVGGRPELKVKAILSAMGDRVDEPILELTDERLLLLDADGETKYDWRRAEAE